MIDVNVWLALATERHQHHAAAKSWFSTIGEQTAAFCRVTQMSFLRLLCSGAVMGEDVVAPVHAWRCYRQLRSDWRVTFATEPSALESTWIELIRSARGSRSWTDAYLAALTIGHGYSLVSFDQGFRQWQGLPLLLLRTPARI